MNQRGFALLGFCIVLATSMVIWNGAMGAQRVGAFSSQGSQTQGSLTQGSLTQGSRTQTSRTQTSRTQTSRTQTSRTQTSRTRRLAAVGAVNWSAAVAKAKQATFRGEAPSRHFAAPPDLNSEHFITSTVGYGVTGAGNILTTGNAGHTWRILLHVPSASFSYLTWKGSIGVASGLAMGGGAAPSMPTVAVTTDNGRVWSVMHPLLPHSVSAADQTYQMAVHPLSSRNFVLLPTPADISGYMGVYPLLVSTDGGADFRSLALPRGWQPTGGFAALSGDEMALTVQNNQSGRTGVALLNAMGGKVRLYSARLPVPLYALDLVSPHTLYAAGGMFSKYATKIAEGFYRLQLGGNGKFIPIKVIPNPMGSNYSPIIELRVLSSGVIAALQGGISPGANGPSRGNLMISRNGGRTFTTTSASGSSFDVLRKQIWMWTGPNYWIYTDWPPSDLYSSNGGRTFTLLPWSGKSTAVNWVQSVSTGRDIVATARGLWQTVNDGAAWKPDALPLTSHVSFIQYAGLGTRWVLQWQDTLATPIVRVSGDGGRTWRALPLPASLNVIDSASIALGGFIAIAGQSLHHASDSVYTSQNEGKSWDTTLGAFGQMQGITIQFVSNEVGYAAYAPFFNSGSQAVHDLYRTTDGGKVWSRIGLGQFTWVSGGDLTHAGDTVIFAGLIRSHGASDFTFSDLTFNEMVRSRAVLIAYNPVSGSVRAVGLGRHIPISLSFSSANVGIMATADGRLYETHDGGASWQALWVSSGAVNPMY